MRDKLFDRRFPGAAGNQRHRDLKLLPIKLSQVPIGLQRVLNMNECRGPLILLKERLGLRDHKTSDALLIGLSNKIMAVKTPPNEREKEIVFVNRAGVRRDLT